MKVCVIQSKNGDNNECNHNECRYECKELNDCGSCKNDHMWNPSTCISECHTTCKNDECLNIKKLLRKKRFLVSFRM